MELVKSIHRHLTVQKDLGLPNSGTVNRGEESGMLNRGEVLCTTVAVDQSMVKIGGNDKSLPLKIR